MVTNLLARYRAWRSRRRFVRGMVAAWKKTLFQQPAEYRADTAPRTMPVPDRLRFASEFTAEWCPAWYDLDQPLRAGERKKLLFFVEPPEHARAEIVRHHSTPPDAVLFSGLANNGQWYELIGEVVSIHNSDFGAISSISSEGFDYIIDLASGDRITVNCEERPGEIFESDRVVSDWTMTVHIRPTENAGANEHAS
ncbi:MAG: hypothetical protein M3463_05875 [Verrucomicrobiota bacterium]|nr:hypothetical protein [Verrucomicrobiota bacterium]